MEEENLKIKLIEVIPVAKGMTKEKLTYFTSVDVTLGSIVSVQLRKKTVSALVVEIKDATDLKSEIKSSPFLIKKADKMKTSKFLSQEFLSACSQAAEYFAASTGAVLNALVPKNVWENLSKLETSDEKYSQSGHEKLVLQTEDEERFADYKSLIREEFARRSSVFFCLPTIGDIENAESFLLKGIENYTFILHNQMSKTEIIETWNKIMSEKHPVLIIATGSYLCIPRKDIGTIVLERESSRAYKMQTRPYLDVRIFAEYLSKKIKAKLLFGDNLLRTETIWRQKNDECAEFASLKFRALSTAQEKLVNTKKEGDNPKKFQIISDELAELIASTKENSENLFIFAARRGLFPVTICGDCGTVLRCENCKSPVILHSTDAKENFFLCHKCGERRSSHEKCKNCDSWKLNTLGIGVERIEKELEEKFPTVKVFRLDKDNAGTHKKAQDIISKFYSTPGSVLIGTEMSLVFLTKKVFNSAVASIDSLFAIPDFRINEKILYILLKVRSLAQRNFILQTRNPEVELLDYALKGNLADFYREEIEQRKAFNYPPFTVLIKITLKGKKEEINEEASQLKETFDPYQTEIFPGYVSEIKGVHILHVLIKVPKNEWPNKELLEKLLTLPRQYSVNVDPESIL